VGVACGWPSQSSSACLACVGSLGEFVPEFIGFNVDFQKPEISVNDTQVRSA
jgi:hypothetical protein